jgi:hypothetical protein
MTLRCFSLFATILAVSAAGCAGNPLDGTWADSASGSGIAATVSLTFNSDGTLDETNDLTQLMGDSCTGALTFTGLTWTSTASDITLTGTQQCASTLSCATLGALTCDQANSANGSGQVTNGSIPYTLESGNNTLVLHSSGGDLTFTRQK